MKNKIKKITDNFAYMLSFFYSYKLSSLLKYFKNRIYSFSVKRNFEKCGTNFYIESPVYLNNPKNIRIGNDFYCFERLRLETFNLHNGHSFNPKISIGNNVSINNNCHIGSIYSIVIEDNVLLASNVFITDHFHGETDLKSLQLPPNKRKLVSKGRVLIKKNVWIGENVAIMPNVTIGENCIIGANSVVTKSFPKNSIIAGTPAKLIKNIE